MKYLVRDVTYLWRKEEGILTTNPLNPIIDTWFYGRESKCTSSPGVADTPTKVALKIAFNSRSHANRLLKERLESCKNINNNVATIVHGWDIVEIKD